jgi:hypothetical protein
VGAVKMLPRVSTAASAGSRVAPRPGAAPRIHATSTRTSTRHPGTLPTLSPPACTDVSWPGPLVWWLARAHRPMSDWAPHRNGIATRVDASSLFGRMANMAVSLGADRVPTRRLSCLQCEPAHAAVPRPIFRLLPN